MKRMQLISSMLIIVSMFLSLLAGPYVVRAEAANATAAPATVLPSGTIYDKTPTFKWTAISGATQYQIQVYKGSTKVVDKTYTSAACSGSYCSGTPTTTLTLAGYTWKVRAYKSGVWSAYSSARIFTVATAVPPATVSPTGTIADTTPTYQWKNIYGATSYQIQVYKGITKVVDKTYTSSACSTTYCAGTPTTVLAYGSHTWKVRVNINGVWTSYSAARSFTVASPPTTVLPSGTIADTTPTYKWTAVSGATDYQVIAYRGGTLAVNNIYLSSVCSGYYCYGTPTTTLAYGSHTWYVRARINGAWTSYSTAKSFSVASPPTSVLPNGSNTDTTPTYKWTAINGASEYQVLVYRGGTLVANNNYLSTACSGYYCYATPATALPYNSYNWYVRAKINDAWTSYSTAKSFTIARIVLKVWSFTNEIKTMAIAFEGLHPDVDVQYTMIPMTNDEYQTQLMATLGTGNGPDVVALEAAFVKAYVESDWLSDLGTLLPDATEANTYDYTIDVGTANGVTKAFAYQATPGAFIYRRSLALDYFGTDDPAAIQALMSDMNKFTAAAAVVKAESGGNTYMVASNGDLTNLFYANRAQPWVVDNTLTVDPMVVKMVDTAKIFRDNGYEAQTNQWDERWFAGMNDTLTDGSGNPKQVFGYFLPTWGLPYVIVPNAKSGDGAKDTSGDWAVISGPVSYYWGGTWLGVMKDSTKQDLAKEFVRFCTLDEDNLTKWATGVYTNDYLKAIDPTVPDDQQQAAGDFVSSQDVVESITASFDDSDLSDFLGGQNPYGSFATAAPFINGSLIQGSDDTIQRALNDPLAAYLDGSITKEQMWTQWKDAVHIQFPDLILVARTVLKVWSFNNEIEIMAIEFEGLHPDVDVQYTKIPMDAGEYQSRLMATLGTSDVPDVVALEAAFVKAYVESDFLADLGTLLPAATEAHTYEYTIDIGTANGITKAFVYQATPGVFYYRRSLAIEYFGTDDPAAIQALMSDMDKFTAAAAVVKEESGGDTYMVASYNDFTNLFYANRAQPWVVDNTLTLDPMIDKMVDTAKIFRDNGYEAQATQWQEDWFAGMNDTLTDDIGNPKQVFGYFLPTWGLPYVLVPNAISGDWAVIPGPMPYYWGGTWLGVMKDSAKQDLAKEFVRFCTLDEDNLTKWATGVYTNEYLKAIDPTVPDDQKQAAGDFVSSQDVVESITAFFDDSDFSNFLGGQNPFAGYAVAALLVDGSLIQGTDDAIQRSLGDPLASYLDGSVTKEQMWTQWKTAVHTEFPDLIIP